MNKGEITLVCIIISLDVDMQKEFDFRELVIKFLAGEITESEIAVLKILLENDVECRRIFDRENELWQDTNIQTKLEYFKTDEGWNSVSSKLGIGENLSKSIIVISKQKFRVLAVAATIACMVAIGGFNLWFLERQSTKKTAEAFTIISTDGGNKAHVFLPDSTQVFINSGSSLKYNANYGKNERIINLSGEAFFDVRTNPEKPFIVKLSKMTVTATGTKFNVLSYDNENRIETTLEEGKIKVEIQDQMPLEVKSGQQVAYFTKTNKTVLSDVNPDTYTLWKENKLRLIDTPFEEALRKIARNYNVIFEIRNSDLLDLKYTATFIDESIEDVMRMLKVVSPINYKIIYRTSANDKKYLMPKIVVSKRKC